MFYTVIDILGTIAFAISGVLVAMEKRLDFFGVVIIAFVTAIGGGTLRDLLIGNTPVVWMRDAWSVYFDRCRKRIGCGLVACYVRSSWYYYGKFWRCAKGYTL